MTNTDPDLPDDVIDRICDGYRQNAAKVRYLRSMGLHVRQKPNGRPLVNRAHYDQVASGQKAHNGADEPTWSVA